MYFPASISKKREVHTGANQIKRGSMASHWNRKPNKNQQLSDIHAKIINDYTKFSGICKMAYSGFLKAEYAINISGFDYYCLFVMLSTLQADTKAGFPLFGPTNTTTPPLFLITSP